MWDYLTIKSGLKNILVPILVYTFDSAVIIGSKFKVAETLIRMLEFRVNYPDEEGLSQQV